MSRNHEKRRILLFQYGSNMDPSRLNSPKRLEGKAKNPRAARLDGWSICFDVYSRCNKCGVTDILPSKSEHVLGVLFEVPYRVVIAPRGERSRMDVVEGAGLGATSNYRRKRILVRVGAEKHEARAYIGTVLARRRFLKLPERERRVSNAYFRHLLLGAELFGFPKRYVAYLKRRAGPLNTG